MVCCARIAISLVVGDAQSGYHVRYRDAVDGETPHRECMAYDCVRAIYSSCAHSCRPQSVSLAEATGGAVVRNTQVLVGEQTELNVKGQTVITSLVFVLYDAGG